MEYCAIYGNTECHQAIQYYQDVALRMKEYVPNAVH